MATRPIASKANIFGIFSGIAYGLILRFAFGSGGKSSTLAVMSIGFVFFVPFVLGVITVFSVKDPSWKYSIFAPWLSVLVFVFFTALLGWEGIICIVIALPIFLFMSSLGGICAKLLTKVTRRMYVFTGILFLPFISSSIESQFALPASQRMVPTQIVINAPADVVWKNIIRIPKIQPQEHHFSLFHAMGFPKPIEATLSREGVGGVRHASFEGGLLFIETITTWQEKKKLVFSIKANTESIPPTTLDQHVTIGGDYFDMLEGAYTIEPMAGNKVCLHLSSTQRLSTRFNAYTALWTEAIMRNIQEYILAVIKQRCEIEYQKLS